MRNLLLAAPSGVAVRWAVLPGLLAISLHAARGRRGLFGGLGPPRPLRGMLEVALLDLGVYGWHRMNHSVSLLWRFHRVHHADLDVDVSTAFRFHPGEVLFSIAVRGLQVASIGPAPELLLRYELLMQLASVFQHSNLRLPAGLERALSYFIVTPRMHGAHHSVIAGERNHYFSVLFSVWDRVFDTWGDRFEEQPPQLGLEQRREEKQLGTLQMMALPFMA